MDDQNHCLIDKCNRVGKLNKTGKRYFIKSYCGKHYESLYRHGDPLFAKDREYKGMRSNALYHTFFSMKQRCNNPNSRYYRDYGSRGIKVCTRWSGDDGFDNFLEDMGRKLKKSDSLDRIDNNGNYEPSNCRWATKHQQSANRRSNNEFVGVSYDKSRGKWVASLLLDGNHVLHKRYDTKQNAIDARKRAVKEYIK